MEKELQQKQQRVESLLETLKKAREEGADSHEDVERIKSAIEQSERDLVGEVGDDEFERLTGRKYLKENV